MKLLAAVTAMCVFVAPVVRAHSSEGAPLGRKELIRLTSVQVVPAPFADASATGRSETSTRLRLAAAGDETLIANPSATPQAPPAPRERSVGRIILGGALGAVGGFFAGGYIGAAIDGDCGGCDDPGFLGFLIGAPIGAVVGGIVGAKFF